MRWEHFELLLALLLVAAPLALSQEDYSPSIKVESHLVVLYVEVWDEKVKSHLGRTFRDCFQENAARIQSLPPSTPFVPKDCYQSLRVNELTKSDFQVFEDGVEQEIESLTIEPISVRAVRDNFGWHGEWSNTQSGRWGTIDLVDGQPGLENSFYRIAYVPKNPVLGACPSIKIRVKRRHSLVYASDHYCNVPHYDTNPLENSKFGQKLAVDLNSDRSGRIPLNYQVGYFYRDGKSVRLDIALEFPWERLRHEWSRGRMLATIGVLGELDGDELAPVRFSDFACCDSETPRGFWIGEADPELSDRITARNAPFILPARFETQVEIAAGRYQLKVILGDGKEFGRLEMPVVIDQFDADHLWISSVMVCKRFRNSDVAKQEDTIVNLAPQYVPLVSRRVRVMPAANTNFRRGEALIAYFEIYEPSLMQQPKPIVTAHMRIIDARTGAVKVEFPEIDGFTYEEPGSTTMRVGSQLKIGDLPKGDYRLEVSATDSTGQRTPVRSANFRME